MNPTQVPTASPESQKQLEALRRSVAKELERKRRLGHYWVVWQDGKPVALGDDAPVDIAKAR